MTEMVTCLMAWTPEEPGSVEMFFFDNCIYYILSSHFTQRSSKEDQITSGSKDWISTTATTKALTTTDSPVGVVEAPKAHTPRWKAAPSVG